MENEQEAVTNTVEETTTVESAPIEKETVDTQSTPVEESSQPEKKVSESVPYERFKEVNDRLKQLEQMVQPQETQNATEYVPPVAELANDMPFDQDTVLGLERWYEQKRENERAAEFVQKHTDDLKDPFIAARTKELIREANARGQKVDQELALNQAKQELETRFAPKVNEAKAEGEKQGMDVANKKELLGAIGVTASKQELDVNKLSSKEYAEYFGLKRVE